MTSNVAIGNPAAASIAPASKAALSDNFAGLLNAAAINGRAPIHDVQRMAGAPRGRPNAPAKIMEGWHKALERAANKATKSAESGKPLVIPVSGSGKSTSALTQLNTIGGKTLKVPGVPEYQGQINGELMVRLDHALTPQRVQVFQGLREGQQTTARTLIGAALEAMSLPKGRPGRIDPEDMDEMVETALMYAQQTPTALDSSAKPAGRAATTPTTQPVPAARPTRTPTTPQVKPEQSASAMGQTPPGRIDRSAALRKVKSLSEQEKTLLRGLYQGKQGANIASEQGWNTAQFRAVRDSATRKLGAEDLRAAVQAAEAGGLLSAKTALPADVAKAEAPAWRDTILGTPEFAHVTLTPGQKKLFFTWIDNKMDRHATATAMGWEPNTTGVMLNKLAGRFGYSVKEMKAAVGDHVATAKAEAPATWPEVARKRFTLLSNNEQVKRAGLKSRDIEILSFWTHSYFDYSKAAPALGLKAESLHALLSGSASKLRLAAGSRGPSEFKRFLLKATTGSGPQGLPAPKPEAPGDWPTAARQRFDNLCKNQKVQQVMLSARELQVLSYWTDVDFDHDAAARRLGIGESSMRVVVSGLSKKLGFKAGATGLHAFKSFLHAATK